MRSAEVILCDGRHIVLRPARMEDAESALRNVNRIGEEERRGLSALDGLRNVLFVAVADDDGIGAAWRESVGSMSAFEASTPTKS